MQDNTVKTLMQEYAKNVHQEDMLLLNQHLVRIVLLEKEQVVVQKQRKTMLAQTVRLEPIKIHLDKLLVKIV